MIDLPSLFWINKSCPALFVRTLLAPRWRWLTRSGTLKYFDLTRAYNYFRV